MSIPDGTTTRETGSNCSWVLVLVLQQNSTEKLNGHWWWCAPAADPHQKISLLDLQQYYLVVVVVDSHIQRIVLATEETTVTQQVSHRPIKCQSRLLWSQRGTKVDGSHMTYMVTTRYSDQQGSKSRQKVMPLYKQWHRPISMVVLKATH